MILKPLALVVAMAALVACDNNVMQAERSEAIELTGTVQSIDAANRRVVVTGGGRRVTLRASDQVRNFDQLEVGDQISLQYQQAVAVAMADPSDSGEPMAVGMEARAAEGQKPGAAAMEITTSVVEFVSYSERTRTATIKTQQGFLLDVAVQPEMLGFARSRVPGDRIVVAIEEAVALTVTPDA